MKKLEEELGAALFERSQRGLVPTAEGEKAYRHIRTMLEEYHALQAELGGAKDRRYSGRIRVVMDVGLVKLLTSRPMLAFSQKYSDVELILEEHRIFNCKKLVLQGKAGLGNSVCVGWKKAMACRELEGLCAEVLLPSGHPLARRGLLTVEDLFGERLLFSECPSYYTFLQEFERAGQEPEVTLSVNEMQTVLAYVQGGAGICPVVYAPGRSAAQYPRGIVSVPYQNASTIALCGYWGGEKPSELEALFLDHLTRQYQKKEKPGAIRTHDLMEKTKTPPDRRGLSLFVAKRCKAAKSQLLIWRALPSRCSGRQCGQKWCSTGWLRRCRGTRWQRRSRWPLRPPHKGRGSVRRIC